MIRVVLLLDPGEVKALRALCRRFRFENALHFLRGVPNIAPDAMIEGVNKLRSALDESGPS